ncbi:MAG: DUF2878 domain-containing protein [Parachlamydiaceae bacterium]
MENIKSERKSMLMSFIKWFINAGLFYLGWLVCMYQATGSYPYLGPLVVLAILLNHFLILKGDRADLILCLTLGAIGTLIDTIYIAIGMLKFEGGYDQFPLLAPLWMTSLWALYAISVNHSLQWLNWSVFLAAGMGAMGAISSYLVGIKLGAVDPLWGETTCFAIIGSVWAIVVPLSLKFGKWLKDIPK